MKTLTRSIKTTALTFASVALLASSSAFAKEKNNSEKMTEKENMYFQNGWNEGKIETAILFNEHLSTFDIEVEVNDKTAYLVGNVGSDIEKDLAEQVALSVDGIETVKNELKVSANEKNRKVEDTDSDFLAEIEDASISAKVKMKLLANENVSGIKIDVDTEDKVVILNGDVKAETIKDLAEKIAENTEGVKSVKNNLNVINS